MAISWELCPQIQEIEDFTRLEFKLSSVFLWWRLELRWKLRFILALMPNFLFFPFKYFHWNTIKVELYQTLRINHIPWEKNVHFTLIGLRFDFFVWVLNAWGTDVMERFIATCSKSCPFRLLSAQLVFCFNSRRVKTRGSFKIGKIKMLQKQKLVSCEQHWETHKGVTFFWSLIEFFLLAGKTQSQICFRLKLGKCTLGGNTPLTSDPLALCFFIFERLQEIWKWHIFIFYTWKNISLDCKQAKRCVSVCVNKSRYCKWHSCPSPSGKAQNLRLRCRENFSPPTRMPMNRTHLDGRKIPGITLGQDRKPDCLYFPFQPKLWNEPSLTFHILLCLAVTSSRDPPQLRGCYSGCIVSVMLRSDSYAGLPPARPTPNPPLRQETQGRNSARTKYFLSHTLSKSNRCVWMFNIQQ